MVVNVDVMKVTHGRHLVAIGSNLDVVDRCCLVPQPCGKNVSCPALGKLPFFVYENSG